MPKIGDIIEAKVVKLLPSGAIYPLVIHMITSYRLKKRVRVM